MCSIRTATLADIDGIMEVQVDAYVDGLVESRRVLSSIVVLQGSYVVCSTGAIIVGYVLAHPSHRNCVHRLHAEVRAHATPDAMFIHDVCVRRSYRREGIASELVRQATKGHAIVQCIALETAMGFWVAQGFRIVQGVELGADIQENYGGQCKFMER
jgi:N-acetylglutamate synthase-like GNAT family acetyltransferase